MSEVVECEGEKPEVSFAQMGLSEPILKALSELGYERPSPIQAESLPILLEGRDLLGMAQTGTGKTAAFALPILQRIDFSCQRPQALVLTPTRELALQVSEAFAQYAKHLPDFRVLPIYGGQSFGWQLKQLQRGAQVVVGTPGRVMDHLERETLSLAQVKTVVLDEADEMLRMGFLEDVEWILERAPLERQTALFSATLPEAVARVARNYLDNPEEVKIRAATQTVAQIRQLYWQVAGMHKLDALTRILEAEENLDAGIIFVRTKLAADELAQKLEARGQSVAALHGDLNQQAREKVIERLKDGSLDLVVATDVAARGIDVPRITHVFNYDIPYDVEAYVHRIGRTGRAGKSGTAILFAAPREMRMLRVIERVTRQPIEPVKLPSSQDVTDRRIARFTEKIAQTLTSADLDFFENLLGTLSAELETSPERLAAAALCLAQQDRPLQMEEKRPRFERERRDDDDDRPRRERRERGPREDRLPRGEDNNGNTVTLTRYRIAVGRNHGATPRDIVGAIANEANLPARLIGRIDLYDDYSTVDLPADLSRETLDILKHAWVRRHTLDIVLDDGSAPPPRRFRDKPRREGRDNRSDNKRFGGDKPFYKKPRRDRDNFNVA